MARAEIDYLAEQAALALKRLEDFRRIVETLETEANTGMTGGVAYRNLLLISGQTDPNSTDVQPNQGILNRQFEIDQDLNALIAALEAMKANSSGIDEIRINEMVKNLKEKRNENQTLGQTVTHVSDRIQQSARDYYATMAAIVESAGASGMQPDLWVNMNPDDRSVFQQINPEAYEYLESLPKPQGQNQGAVGGVGVGTAAGTAGTGGSSGGGGAGGTQGAGATTAPTRKPNPLSQFGTFNGTPIYYNPVDETGEETSRSIGKLREEYDIGEGYLIRFYNNAIELIPTGGGTAGGMAFTYEQLANGAVDLTQFGGEVASGLQDLQGTLQREQEERRARADRESWEAQGYTYSEDGKSRVAFDGTKAQQSEFVAPQPDIPGLINPLLEMTKEVGLGASRSRTV